MPKAIEHTINVKDDSSTKSILLEDLFDRLELSTYGGKLGVSIDCNRLSDTEILVEVAGFIGADALQPRRDINDHRLIPLSPGDVKPGDVVSPDERRTQDDRVQGPRPWR